MANRSKVELYEQIRKAHDRDELSIRALASLFHAYDTSLVPGFWTTELLSVADGWKCSAPTWGASDQDFGR